jgi:hypothetical protein
MDWINDPRLWVALTPMCVFIGAAIAFYIATETGDEDPSPAVVRGATEWEPWGKPFSTKKYRLPGDSVRRTNRVIEHDTAMLNVVKDERKYDLAEVPG